MSSLQSGPACSAGAAPSAGGASFSGGAPGSQGRLWPDTWSSPMACGVGVGGAEAATRVCPHAAAQTRAVPRRRGKLGAGRRDRARSKLPPLRNSRFAPDPNGLLSTFVYNTHAQWACITTTRITTTNRHLATLDMLAEAHRLDSHAQSDARDTPACAPTLRKWRASLNMTLPAA